MAGVRQKTYVFAYSGINFGIKLPENYYQNVDALVGISEASDANKPLFTLTQRQCIRAGVLSQIGILYKKGNRLTRSIILCVATKQQQALSDLEGKTYRGFEIRSAYIPMQRRLG